MKSLERETAKAVTVLKRFKERFAEMFGEEKLKLVEEKVRELRKHEFHVINELNIMSYLDIAKTLVEIGREFGINVELLENVNEQVIKSNHFFVTLESGRVVSYLPLTDGIGLVPLDVFEELKRKERIYLEDAEEEIFLKILKKALQLEASDIHIHPKGSTYHVYFRVKRDFKHMGEFTLPADKGKGMVLWLKRKAHQYTKGAFKADVMTLVQDARAVFPEYGVMLRLSFAPTPDLEHQAVVARILKTQALRGDLRELGYLDEDIQVFEDVLRRSGGVVVVSGITNSGKSTLVSTLLSTEREKKVITIEDPVEYILSNPNIIQYQVFETEIKDMKADFIDFAKAVKRQDSDIVFIGEWRNDPRLTKIIEELSQAGQLIFTTLHINSAFVYFEAVSSMYGVPYELLVRTLIMSLNQKLIHKVCNNCGKRMNGKEAVRYLTERGIFPIGFFKHLPYTNWNEFYKRLIEREVWIKGEGCEICNGKGTSGLTPVYEYFYPNLDFLEWIRKEKPTPYEIEKRAREEGIGKNKLDVFLQKVEELPLESLLALR